MKTVDADRSVSREVLVSDRTVMVRDSGDPDGPAVVYFHGTPGSRLDIGFGDQVASRMGVRVVSFDRPGYGRSEPGPFGLTRVARDALAIADDLGLERFATLGWSGGGPFALAAAAVAGDRVTRVGVASAPGPFQLVPGALASLGDNDVTALSMLPDRPARAAEQFCVGTEIMVAVRDDEQALMMGMEALLGETDADVFADPVLRHHLFVMISEGLRQGMAAGGWDNVAWVGPWDVDLSAVRCPVHLWYGERDPMAPLVHGQWLHDHLLGAELVVYDGEGHLGPMRHWPEILGALTQCG